MAPTYPDSVCAECVDDDALRAFIRKNLTSDECGYCGKSSDNAIAADLGDLVSEIEDGIAFEWTDPANILGWDGAEGGYQGETFDAQELFDHIGLPTANDDLGEAIIASLGDQTYCEQDYYVGSEQDRLKYGWEEFCSRVKHKARYFFMKDSEADALVRGPADFDPATVIDLLGKAIQAAGMIKTLSARESIYRARIHASDKTLTTATELGAPPAEHARYPNRASAAGIPMFYGAFDSETALAEILDEDIEESKVATVGRFRAARPLLMIDLTAIPPMPSLYDRKNRNLRTPVGFLESFTADFSAPVAKDGREHIDYVPTQVVTEYFRHIFKSEGRQIDGLMYHSSRRKGGRCAVIFCENSACVDDSPGWDSEREAVLGLRETKVIARDQANALRKKG